MVKVKVKIKGMVIVMILDTQIRFSENLVKIRQVILFRISYSVESKSQGLGQGHGHDLWQLKKGFLEVW